MAAPTYFSSAILWRLCLRLGTWQFRCMGQDKGKIDHFGFLIDELEPRLDVPIDPSVEKVREAKWRKMLDQWQTWTMRPAKLRSRVAKGIPHTLRGEVWPLLARSNVRRAANPQLYQSLLANGENRHTAQIRLDLERTYATHIYFKDPNGQGQKDLFDVLKAYAYFNSHIGYCQGMSFIAGLLLMFMPAEDAFFLFVEVMERLDNVHDPKMQGLMRNAELLDKMLRIEAPQISQHLEKCGVSLLYFATPWFVTLFTNLACWSLVLRIVDLFMLEGPAALFRYAIALLKSNEEELLARGSLEKLMLFLCRLPPARLHPDAICPLASAVNLERLLALAAQTPVTPLKKRPAAAVSAPEPQSLFGRILTPLKKSIMGELFPPSPAPASPPTFTTPQVGSKRRRPPLAPVTYYTPTRTQSPVRPRDADAAKENADFGINSPAFKEFSTPKKLKTTEYANKPSPGPEEMTELVPFLSAAKKEHSPSPRIIRSAANRRMSFTKFL